MNPILKIFLITATILLIPLIAMQFTDEVNWDLTDFIVAEAILLGFGLLYELMKTPSASTLITYAFFLLFFIIGVLNAFLVHIVPGIFYMLLSLLYVPATNDILKRKFNFSISNKAKVILGLLILWPTLAVGDLAEILGL